MQAPQAPPNANQLITMTVPQLQDEVKKLNRKIDGLVNKIQTNPENKRSNINRLAQLQATRTWIVNRIESKQ